MSFNKTDLVNHVAKESFLPKHEAHKVIDVVFSGIMQGLGREGEAKFIGLGSFSVAKLAERQGRNPQTGKPMAIPASNRPTFRAGKELKEAVNQQNDKKKKRG